ncbi:MAG: hypothetical protein SGPRY_007639 [Prymnesium sp.]
MEEAAVARANVVSAAVRWCEQRGRTVRLHELVQGVGERAGALPLEVSERTRERVRGMSRVVLPFKCIKMCRCESRYHTEVVKSCVPKQMTLIDM